MTAVIFCPECETRLDMGQRAHKGQRIICPECDTHLLLTNLEPLELSVNTKIGNSNKSKVVDVDCPKCETFIRLNATLREGQMLTCPSCYTALEVVSTNPFELDIAVIAQKKKMRRPKDEVKRKNPVKQTISPQKAKFKKKNYS